MIRCCKTFVLLHCNGQGQTGLVPATHKKSSRNATVQLCAECCSLIPSLSAWTRASIDEELSLYNKKNKTRTARSPSLLFFCHHWIAVGEAQPGRLPAVGESFPAREATYTAMTGVAAASTTGPHMAERAPKPRL